MPWSELITDNATTDDTISLIIKCINDYHDSPIIKEIVKYLNPDGSKLQFTKRLFDFVNDVLKYQRDLPGKEVVKTPERILMDALKGIGADCKKMTSLIAAVCKAVGIEPLLKVISYDGKHWEHIYVIVKIADNIIVLDPVNAKQYNKEISHSRAKIYNLKGDQMELHMMGNPPTKPNASQTMPAFNLDFNGAICDINNDLCTASHAMFGPPVNENRSNPNHPTIKKAIAAGSHKIFTDAEWERMIDGFEQSHKSYFPDDPMHQGKGVYHQDAMSGMGSFWSKLKSKVSNVVHKVESGVATAAKNVGKAVEKGVAAVGHALKTVGLAVPRNAFLGLIHAGNEAEKILHVHYGKHMANAWNKNPQQVKDFWTKWGGNPNNLRNAIIAGSGGKDDNGTPISGPDDEYMGCCDDKYEPGIGIAPLALAAAAAPILVAGYDLLKATGVIKPGTTADAAMAAATGIAVDAQNDDGSGDALDAITAGVTAADQALQKPAGATTKKTVTKKTTKPGQQTAGGFYDSNDYGNNIFKSLFFMALSSALPLIPMIIFNILGTFTILHSLYTLNNKHYELQF